MLGVSGYGVAFSSLVNCLNRVIIVSIGRLAVALRSAIVRIYIDCSDSGSILCGILCYNWVTDGTVASVRHCGVGSGTFVLGVSGVMSGSFFTVYYVGIGSEPERSRFPVIIALETELSCLASWDVDSRLPCRFRNTDLDFLWWVLMVIVCDSGDGCRNVGIGVILDSMIVA